MHLVFSYDLQIPAGQRRQEVENRIEAILQPYRHVRRLTSFYIVHIATQADWDTLLNSFTSLSREISEPFRFIMSPPMDGGRYNGILLRGDWDEVNQITSM